MNLELLKHFLFERNIKVKELARKMNWSYSLAKRKLDGSIEFFSKEIMKITQILRLTSKERDLIFFNDDVEK